MNYLKLPTHLNRRQVIQLMGMSGIGYLLSSCSNEGYKLSKWVTKVTFASQIPKGGKGYWEEQGYEWFSGI
jgi:hypothetical protein